MAAAAPGPAAAVGVLDVGLMALEAASVITIEAVMALDWLGK